MSLLLLFLLLSKSKKNVSKAAIHYKRDIWEVNYEQQNKNESNKYFAEIMSNIDTSLVELYKVNENNNINSLPTFRDKNYQATAPIRNQKKSLTSKQHSASHLLTSSTFDNRKLHRIRHKEIPFNVTGWPNGVSLSVEDYVNYFQSTSMLMPDTSKDSSTFDESNGISVLIGIGMVHNLI